MSGLFSCCHSPRTSFLALPPLGKGTLPKRVEQETVPGTAPDLASTLAALKAKAEQAKVPSEAQAEPSQTNAPVKILDQSCNGSQHAPDLAGDLAALLAKKNQENATQALAKPSADHLHTVRLIKQYVPIEKNGTVVAYKTAYFGKMHVGSPQPQNFTVVFDTGSAHLVIPNSACQRDTCLKHNRDPGNTGKSCFFCIRLCDFVGLQRAKDTTSLCRKVLCPSSTMALFYQREVFLSTPSALPSAQVRSQGRLSKTRHA